MIGYVFFDFYVFTLLVDCRLFFLLCIASLLFIDIDAFLWFETFLVFLKNIVSSPFAVVWLGRIYRLSAVDCSLSHKSLNVHIILPSSIIRRETVVVTHFFFTACVKLPLLCIHRILRCLPLSYILYREINYLNYSLCLYTPTLVLLIEEYVIKLAF